MKTEAIRLCIQSQRGKEDYIEAREELDALLARLEALEAAQPLRAVDAAKVCHECDGAIEFCSMGHYVQSAPRT